MKNQVSFPARRVGKSIEARNRLIAAVHVAGKKRGIDEDSRRDLMERITGKRSAADLSLPELGRVLDAINRPPRAKPEASATARPSQCEGSQTSGGESRRLRTDEKTPKPWTAKIKALWISAHQLGLTETASGQALDAFVSRQTGVSALRFLPADRASAVIEALKDWLARDGGVQWGWPKDADDRQCVAIAIWTRLGKAGVVIDDYFALNPYCRKVLGIHQARSLTPQEWGRMLPILAAKLAEITEGVARGKADRPSRTFARSRASGGERPASEGQERTEGQDQ